MTFKQKVFREVARLNKNLAVLIGIKLTGIDVLPAYDEDVWRTTEEGKHFKFDNETGEIKAGFGGKFNGQKLGTSFGEKRDWIKKLPKGKQERADRLIEKYAGGQRTVKKLNSLQKKGVITEEKKNEILKKIHLDGVDPNASPEKVLMKSDGNIYDKLDYVWFLDETNEWEDTAGQKIQSNLTEKEQLAVKNLCEKYGAILSNDGFNIPNYKFGEKWTDEDLSCWLDLKSKACGGPTSGREIPEHLLKELETNQGPNYDWFTPAHYGNMEHTMADITGDNKGWHHQWTKEEFGELNQKFVDQIKYGKLSPNKISVSGIMAISYLKGRMGITQSNKVQPEMISRLSEEEQQNLLNIVNTFAIKGKSNSGFSPVSKIEDLTFEDLYQAEYVMRRLNMNNYRSAESLKPFRNMILLQEKMLTGVEPAASDPFEAEKKKQETEKKAEERRKTETIRKEQDDFRNSDAAKAKAQKIERIRNLDIDALQSDRYDRFDVENAANDAGFFSEGSRFATDGTMSKDTYVRALRAYQKVVNRFPFLAGELSGFGDHQGGSSTASCCKFEDGTTEVRINFDKFRDHDALVEGYKYSESVKWHPPLSQYVSPEEAAITHELGHVLANWLHRATKGSQFEPSNVGYYAYYDNDVATLLKARTMKALGLEATVENIKNEVSMYAAASRLNKKYNEPKCNTKADEFFAECFSELVCSPHPRRAALEFGRQLEKFIQDNHIDSMTSANTPSTRRTSK